MNRYFVVYDHPAWHHTHWMSLEAESQEAAETEAQRRLDEREPLGWRERGEERAP